MGNSPATTAGKYPKHCMHLIKLEKCIYKGKKKMPL